MSEQEQKYYSWQTGLPTGPDVESIRKKWPELKVGDRIAYADVETVLEVQKASSRWRAITNAWRKREREAGFVIECAPGQYFYVASAGQIMAGTYQTLKFIGRKASKQKFKLKNAMRHADNDGERDGINHQARLMDMVEKDAKKHRMNMLPSTTPKQVQIAPPEAAG